MDSGEIRFVVDDWAAMAPGLSTQQEWMEWFREPKALVRDFAPELAWMPAALRRRVSPLGRAALSVLATCQPPESCPVVFASRYADLDATGRLLAQLHQDGGVSPMGFSLSVHNAAPGLYSIARHDRTPTTSIAANVDLAEAACFEALGCLLSGASQVLVVCCEDVVPPPYKEDGGHWEFRHAWACRLRLALSGCLSLEAAEAAGEPAAMPMEPPSLRALSFLAGARGRSLVSDTGRYVWRRHD